MKQELDQLRDEQNQDREKIIQVQIDLNNAQSLKELMLEPSLRPYFLENTFHRLIKRSLEGQEIGNFENLQKFNVDDLKNAVNSVKELTDLNRRFRIYINKLKKDNERVITSRRFL